MKLRLSVRRVLYVCLLLLVILVLFRGHSTTAPLDHSHNSHVLYSPGSSNGTTTEKWEAPPPLRELVPFVRGSKEADELRDHPWTRPKIFMTYARPLHTNESHTQVFLYATGVRMGKYERNVTVVGCLIGLDVFHVLVIPGDVYVCNVNRDVEVGEHVSLVLLRDAVLEKALHGMVLGGWNVTMQQEDIRELPKGVNIRLKERRKVDEYAVLSFGGTISYVASGVETLRNRVRYKVCMGTQMKTFPHLLEDWARYHRKLGVDQVYILDNAAEKPLEEFVPPDMGVETVYWPFPKSQIQAMSLLLVGLRERCEWVLLSDADEYVLLGVDKRSKAADLREYLDRIPKYEVQHYLPYLTMGVSGHVKLPKGPVAEEYTYKHTWQKHNGKTFTRTDAPWMSSKIHVAWRLGKGDMARDEVQNEEPEKGDQGVLVHFQNRSFEEMMMKRATGSGSLGDKQFGGGNKTTFKKGRVPKGYRVYDEELRYTFFRDVWRIVEMTEMVTCLVRGHERRLV